MSELVKNEDFYLLENGLMVFTKKYHLKRGYCCKNDCLHCPYSEIKDKKRVDNLKESASDHLK